mmetsp:Transcript_5889/g.12933  ORF Transcript_5889/g.12933 Transcript_5889/m.12933 type:complete len:85 (+) Transcript_5889:39-293(+)
MAPILSQYFISTAPVVYHYGNQHLLLHLVEVLLDQGECILHELIVPHDQRQPWMAPTSLVIRQLPQPQCSQLLQQRIHVCLQHC